MDLVMMNGHVACLKTTLSYLLAPRLRMGHVTTSVLGHFEPRGDDTRFFQLRDRRYQIAAEMVEHYLARGVSVVVDGTFALPRWREPIYRAAVRHHLKEVVAITCECSQPELIARRLAYRRQTPCAPDAEANDLAAYEGSVRTFVPLGNDRLPDRREISRIVFDSGTNEVTVLKAAGGLCDYVARAISELAASGILDQPLFTARSQLDSDWSRPFRRFVAIEGIGGSGKTTLARNLGDALCLRSSVACVRIIDEFSSGSLGSFIRSRLFGEMDFRIRTLPSGASQLDSLLVIADMVDRLQEAAASAPGTVGIFDSFQLSRIAHARALLPRHTDSSVADATTLAVETLCQQLPPLPGPVFTVLLDMPPEVAAARLENRVGHPLDQEQRGFLKALSDAFDELATHGKVNARIDATRSNEAVTLDLLETLSAFLEP